MSDRFYDIVCEANAVVENMMSEAKGKWLTPSTVGLDPRCGSKIYLSADFAVIDAGCMRTYDYYGGFEYIEPEHRMQMGDYVVFNSDSSRILRLVEAAFEGE